MGVLDWKTNKNIKICLFIYTSITKQTNVIINYIMSL